MSASSRRSSRLHPNDFGQYDSPPSPPKSRTRAASAKKVSAPAANGSDSAPVRTGALFADSAADEPGSPIRFDAPLRITGAALSSSGSSKGASRAASAGPAGSAAAAAGSSSAASRNGPTVPRGAGSATTSAAGRAPAGAANAAGAASAPAAGGASSAASTTGRSGARGTVAFAPQAAATGPVPAAAAAVPAASGPSGAGSSAPTQNPAVTLNPQPQPLAGPLPVPPPVHVPALRGEPVPAAAAGTHIAAPTHAGFGGVGSTVARIAAAGERWLASLSPRKLLLLLLAVAYLAGPSRIAAVTYGVITLPLRPLSALGEWVDFATGNGPAADEITYTAGSYGGAPGSSSGAGAGDAAGSVVTPPSAASLAAAESLRAAAAVDQAAAAEAGSEVAGGASGAAAAAAASAAVNITADDIAKALDIDQWIQAAAAPDAAAAAGGAPVASLPVLPSVPLAALLARVAAMDRRLAAHYSVISDSLLPRLDGAEAIANNAVKAAFAASATAEDAGRRADAAAAAAREATGTLAAAAAAVGAVAEQSAATQALRSDMVSLVNDVSQLRSGQASTRDELLSAVKAAQDGLSSRLDAVETAAADVPGLRTALTDASARLSGVVSTVDAMYASIAAARTSAAAGATAAAANAAAAQQNASTETSHGASAPASEAAQAAILAAAERLSAFDERIRALEVKAAALVTGTAETTGASASAAAAAAGAASAGAVATDAAAVSQLATAVAELRQQTQAALAASIAAAVATGGGSVRPDRRSYEMLRTQFSQWRSAAPPASAGSTAVSTDALAGSQQAAVQQLLAIVPAALALADGVSRASGPGAGMLYLAAGLSPHAAAAAASSARADAGAASAAPLTAVTRVVSPGSGVADGYFGAWLSRSHGHQGSVDAAAHANADAAADAASAVSASLADVASLVNAAIAAYAADAVALPDYALASGGACVVTDAPAYALTSRTWAAPSAVAMPGPRTALTPSLQLGHCWPMAGTEGRLTVRLARSIAITAVTIDHPQLAIALDRSAATGAPGLASGSASAASSSVLPPHLAGLNSAAPRSFRLYGYTADGDALSGHHAPAAAEGGHAAGSHNATTAVPAGEGEGEGAADAAAVLHMRRVLLGSFQYDVSGPRTQTFLLPKQHMQAHQAQTQTHTRSPMDALPADGGAALGVAEPVFSHVTLEVASNHGHPHFTCLYRVRVHGAVPHSHAAAAHVPLAAAHAPSSTGMHAAPAPAAAHALNE